MKPGPAFFLSAAAIESISGKLGAGGRSGPSFFESAFQILFPSSITSGPNMCWFIIFHTCHPPEYTQWATRKDLSTSPRAWSIVYVIASTLAPACCAQSPACNSEFGRTELITASARSKEDSDAAPLPCCARACARNSVPKEDANTSAHRSWIANDFSSAGSTLASRARSASNRRASMRESGNQPASTTAVSTSIMRPITSCSTRCMASSKPCVASSPVAACS
mmetsp:Transcript_19447/g.46897  ORF Transcript_19447/g.46897 Transcript_19447/m.46897 type:complete len:223 (-) Transcript_19447:1141-1809(-)